MSEKRATPMLDDLEKGPWPSFVTQIKEMAAEGKEQCGDLLGHARALLRGQGGPLEARRHRWRARLRRRRDRPLHDLPDEFPASPTSTRVRVNQPAGWFYTSDALRTICDIWDGTARASPTCTDPPATWSSSAPRPTSSSRSSRS